MKSTRLLAAFGASAITLAVVVAGSAPGAALASAEPDRLGIDQERISLDQIRPVLTPSRLHSGDPEARFPYFVRIAGPGAADAAARAGGGARGATAARVRSSAVRRTASALLSSARRADGQAASLYTATNAIPGAGMRLDRAGYDAVLADSRVVSVRRIVPKTTSNSNAVSLVKALATWKFSGNTGKGVTIGVIDTGIDFTHADFGGKGTVAAFDAAFAESDSPTWRQQLPKLGKNKVVGGYDFAGDSYNADPGDPDYQPIPQPDNNPLDCADNGHGTHVAGTAAGYGVKGNHKTFTGKYKKLNRSKLKRMDIGPGTAPQAGIYALRVFGCAGSTDVVIPALDRALDPNGDGYFNDRLDIVNMSLGSDYGPVDDPDNDVIDALSKHGVLSVIAIGNNGDLTDTGGSPGNAVSSLAVASSVDAFQLRDGLKVNAPASAAGISAGQMSVAYDWPNNGPTGSPVTGSVVKLSQASNVDGCQPLSPADQALVAGKVTWLVWDSDDSTRRCGSAGRSGNVAAAGGIGAIFTGDVEPFAGGITGSAVIPVFQLSKASTAALNPAATAGTLNVTFNGGLQATVKDYNKFLTDTISSFTSRGPHGSIGVVKPDVAAPGDTIASAGVGTGNKVLVESGTSMASPATAGVSALVKAAHPGWNPLRVKAAVMNTARHDLYSGPGKKGSRYGPARVGSGRIDAKAAVKTKFLAYTVGANNPVSVSFGVVPAVIDGGLVTRTKQVVVQNFGKKKTRVRLSYQPIISTPGVRYSVSPRSVKVRGKSLKRVTVTMTVDPTKLRHTIDPTMEAFQLDTPRQFVTDASGRLLVNPAGAKPLRVPVYGAPKPVSKTTAALNGSTIEISGRGFEAATADGYTSVTSVFEHGASSPKLPVCDKGEPAIDCATYKFERAGDIAEVGAASTNGPGGFIYFAMSTHEEWSQLGILNSPEFGFEVDGRAFYSYVSALDGSDLYYALTFEVSSTDDPDELVDAWPINFLDGDVDTNVFDTDVVILPISKEALGVTAPGSLPLTYSAYSYNGWYGDYTDGTKEVGYDAGDQNIRTDDVLFLDDDGTEIELAGSGGNVAMVVHLHGRKGHRVEFVTVPDLS